MRHRQPKGVRFGGRKKGTKNKRTLEIGKACTALAPMAMQRLQAIALQTKDLATAASACKLILAYAYGKPRERVEVTGAGDGPLRFTLSLGDTTLGNGHDHDGA